MKWLDELFTRICRVFKGGQSNNVRTKHSSQTPSPAQIVRQLETVRTEELPQNLSWQEVYVLGEGGNVWFVALLCPCGCGALLQMSLLPGADPRWHLIQHDDGSVSLQPSVWRKVGCRSHFFIRRGRIDWCRGVT